MSKEKFRMNDPALRAKAEAAKAAKMAERGGLTPVSLVTLLAAETLVATGKPITAPPLAAAFAVKPAAMHTRLATLRRQGFLRKDGYGGYARTDKPAAQPTRARDLRALSNANEALLRQAKHSPALPMTVAAPNHAKQLRAAIKALAPFARYGAKLAGQSPDMVPTLIRRDGITNRDFQDAMAAYAELMQETSEREAEAPVDEGMDRYL